MTFGKILTVVSIFVCSASSGIDLLLQGNILANQQLDNEREFEFYEQIILQSGAKLTISHRKRFEEKLSNCFSINLQVSNTKK